MLPWGFTALLSEEKQDMTLITCLPSREPEAIEVPDTQQEQKV